MRYQYLSLAYALRHNSAPNVDMKPNLHKNSYKDWNDFYKRSNNLLDPDEKCDCKNEGSRFYENRRFAEKSQHPVTVTFVMHQGTKPIQYTDNANSLWSSPAARVTTPVHAVGLTKYIQKVHSEKPINWVLLNIGYFGLRTEVTNDTSLGEMLTTTQQGDFLKKLLEAIKNLTQARIIWKTTTYRYGEYREDFKEPAQPTEALQRNRPSRKDMNYLDAVACNSPLVEVCMNTSWTMHVNKEHFWNSNHFLEPVYSVLNSQLMHLLN